MIPSSDLFDQSTLARLLAHDPVSGDLMLADPALPFNEADVTSYRPLPQCTVVAPNQFLTLMYDGCCRLGLLVSFSDGGSST